MIGTIFDLSRLFKVCWEMPSNLCYLWELEGDRNIDRLLFELDIGGGVACSGVCFFFFVFDAAIMLFVLRYLRRSWGIKNALRTRYPQPMFSFVSILVSFFSRSFWCSLLLLRFSLQSASNLLLVLFRLHFIVHISIARDSVACWIVVHGCCIIIVVALLVHS